MSIVECANIKKFNQKFIIQLLNLFHRRESMKKLFQVCFLFFVSIGSLVACSNSSTSELTTVRVAEVTRSVFYAPFYVAINEGFFEEEGIEIELTTTPGGDKTMTTLLSDGADVALVGSETSIYVANQGARDLVINFAVLTQTDGTFLVAREAIQDFQWDQLLDTTFLGQREGGMPQMVGEYVLKQHGIDPKNDLTLIQNIDFANIASAFASGTGDFVQLFEPTASIFEAEGTGYVVASFGAESGTVPYTTFMAKDSFIDENPDLIHAFTRALYRAQQWVYTQSPEVIAQSVQVFFPDTPLDIITSSVARYQAQESFASTPLLDEAKWNQLQEIMITAGQLNESAPYETLVNPNFAIDTIKE